MTTWLATRYTTANIAGDLNDAQARSDYGFALARTDILCTQEMQRRDAARFVDGRVWGTAQANGKSARARCAIHWRKARYQEKARGNPLLHASRMFPSATRYLEWVRLYDVATHRFLTVIDVHMVPHADDSRGGITEMPRRRLVMLAMTVLLCLVKASTRSQVVVMGDFNTDLRTDLTRKGDGLVEAFRTVGLTSSAAVLGIPRDTHGRNLYDQMWFKLGRRKNPVIKLRSQTVHPKRHSDHRAYSVTALYSVRKLKK